MRSCPKGFILLHLAADPSAAYDAEYGQGFIDPERFVTSIYRSLTTEKFPRRPVRGG